MSFIPNDYEYTQVAHGSAEDGRRWVLEECIDRTDGTGVGFRLITTQLGDAIGESYRTENAFVGGVVVLDGDEIHIEAETAEQLARELKAVSFSDKDVTDIVYVANATSVKTVRRVK